MSTPPNVTDLPDYPLPTDPPATFNTKANAYVAGMDIFVDQLQALIAWMGTNIGYSQPISVADSVTSIEAANVGTYIRLTGSTAKTVNVPNNASVPLTLGSAFNFRNVGAGGATFVEGSGVTINPPLGGTLVFAPGAAVTLIFVGANEFDLIGQTVAA